MVVTWSVLSFCILVEFIWCRSGLSFVQVGEGVGGAGGTRDSPLWVVGQRCSGGVAGEMGAVGQCVAVARSPRGSGCVSGGHWSSSSPPPSTPTLLLLVAGALPARGGAPLFPQSVADELAPARQQRQHVWPRHFRVEWRPLAHGALPAAPASAQGAELLEGDAVVLALVVVLEAWSAVH